MKNNIFLFHCIRIKRVFLLQYILYIVEVQTYRKIGLHDILRAVVEHLAVILAHTMLSS